MLQHVSVLHLFLWLNNVPLYGHTTFCLSIHWLIRHWSCFSLLPIVNSVATIIHEQVFV